MNTKRVAVYLFAAALVILVEQYVTYGILWSWSDFLHHENFAAILFAFSAGILAYTFIKRRHSL